MSVTAGAGGVPVPLSATVCGLPVASSAIKTLAVRLPVAPGVNVTEIVQLAPAARLAGQSLVWAKSAALVPTRPMLQIVSAADQSW